MSIWEHARSKIFNQSQHPLTHDLSDFLYVNSRLPNVHRVDEVLDYIVAVLYPRYIGTYPTPADLPGTANPNDYAIVSDDGDGKSAGYVYSKLDNAAQWIKRYDVDWSLDNVLSEATNRTLPMTVQKYGFDDIDPSGSSVTGLYAGQKVYGGASANTNLTLDANSGDSPGAHTGFVQVDDNFRPTTGSAYTCGTNTERWSSVFSDAMVAGHVTVTGASVSSDTGAISFGANNLSTTGSLTGGSATFSTTASAGTLTIGSGSITDSSGAIGFGSANLVTTGTMIGGSGSRFGTLTFSNGQIVDSGGSISFGSTGLSTTGSFSAGSSTVTSLAASNMLLSGSTLSVTAANTDLTLVAQGTGSVAINSPLRSLSQTVTGSITASGSVSSGNISVGGTGLTSSAGNLTLTPGAGGNVSVGGSLLPSAALDLGLTASPWRNLYLTGSLSNGTTSVALSDLLALRNMSFRDAARTQPAQAGDALFWDAASGTFLASHPDTEINHTELSGLTGTGTDGDAGHSQFAVLTGRTGGQVLRGGAGASDNLILESTANAAKGTVQVRDALTPATDAAYSGTWAGTNLGSATRNFNDVYAKGVFKGFRLENYTSTTLPSASASSVGRAVYSTDNNKIYLDTGGTWAAAGVGKFISDTTWNGSQTQQDFTTSGISDCRNCIIQLLDNTNQYERVFCSIRATAVNTVRVTASPALPAGTYRLIVME